MTDSAGDLAATINSAVASSAPTPTVGQGVVTAWNAGTTPPTVAVQISGASTSTNLQYNKSYVPHVGDIVQLIGQQGSWLVLCAIAQNALPSVAGIDVSGTPSAGALIKASSATAAAWAVPGAISVNAQGSATTATFTSSGGSDRTTEPMFWYVQSAVITVDASSNWSWVSGGITFNGCGTAIVSSGDNGDDLIVPTLHQSMVFIDGSGNLNLGGGSWSWTGSQLNSSTSGNQIRVNIAALCW